jgi:hypothetical protein
MAQSRVQDAVEVTARLGAVEDAMRRQEYRTLWLIEKS